jgi:hypothetical protein
MRSLTNSASNHALNSRQVEGAAPRAIPGHNSDRTVPRIGFLVAHRGWRDLAATGDLEVLWEGHA